MVENEKIRLARVPKNNVSAFSALLDEATMARYRSDPELYGIGASFEGRMAGILLYTYNGTVCAVTWLAVSDNLRRMGIATFLVDQLCRAADERQAVVLIDFFMEEGDAADERYAFVQSLRGFTVTEDEEIIYRAEGEEILTGPLEKFASKMRPEAKGLFRLSEVERRRLYERIGTDAETVGEREKPFKPLCLYAGTPEAPRAVLFVIREDASAPEELTVSYFWTKNRDPADIMSVMIGFYYYLMMQKKENKPLGGVRFLPSTEKYEELIRTFVPAIRPVSRCISAMWDMEIYPG